MSVRSLFLDQNCTHKDTHMQEVREFHYMGYLVKEISTLTPDGTTLYYLIENSPYALTWPQVMQTIDGLIEYSEQAAKVFYEGVESDHKSRDTIITYNMYTKMALIMDKPVLPLGRWLIEVATVPPQTPKVTFQPAV